VAGGWTVSLLAAEDGRGVKAAFGHGGSALFPRTLLRSLRRSWAGSTRYLAEHLAGATLIELAGIEQTLLWETPELALDHIERFLTR
jgi:hypothetical protein